MAKKRMTLKQKKFNAELKKKMQKEGIIPLDKPKLNRKKFVMEAAEGWNSRERGVLWDIYIMRSIGIMLGHRECRNGRCSLEAVGAAKILKIALKLHEFYEDVRTEGKKEYRVVDEYNYVRNIMNA